VEVKFGPDDTMILLSDDNAGPANSCNKSDIIENNEALLLAFGKC
jgi:hypothetical protein